MKITSIEVYQVKNPQETLRAFVRVVLENELQLTSMRLYQGSKGLFLAYPPGPAGQDERSRQMFCPLTQEFREQVENSVIEKYNSIIGLEEK